MKWNNDPHKYLKNDILDLITNGHEIENAEKISLKKVFDCIDEFIEKLTKVEE